MPRSNTSDITILPANKASWDDLETILGGAHGDHAGCWCQRFKLSGRDFHHRTVTPSQRAHRLRDQTHCGEPRARKTSGLVAYIGKEPIAWCAVEPRCAYIRLGQSPWKGRAEDPKDETIWALTCFVVRTGFRRTHITYTLARAAIDFARQRGARALEGYAMITEPGQTITWGELHVGARSAFAAAGFREVHQPSRRRVVMRIDF